ncbi:hypothetical protein RIF29_00253 [Crotalaria pallida]|uniref:snRNA-activating protein complex subunit 3 n=1 Tax=Crotalaria pallida TaxID=3830 RepID=A0AAN9P6F7_CROPI
MHKMHICDLRFRLGAGYLYCHQGDCNHTLVIRDMRLLHPDDVQNRAAYPIITFQLKLRFQKCSVCKIFRATKVTVDDKWTPENPCFFCDDCFALLHLDEDGSPLYTEFTEYDYNHD